MGFHEGAVWDLWFGNEGCGEHEPEGSKLAQKSYIGRSLGPKALAYESLEPKGYRTP